MVCCCVPCDVSLLVMFIIIVYHMTLSLFYMRITYYERSKNIILFDDDYYRICYSIFITCPILFIIYFHSLFKSYRESINRELRIRDLLKVKKYLAEENTFLKKKYDLPVHLKRVCVSHLIGENDYNCPICLDEVNVESNVYLTICGHLFHNDCIDKSLDYSKKCPTCRKIIVYNDFDLL